MSPRACTSRCTLRLVPCGIARRQVSMKLHMHSYILTWLYVAYVCHPMPCGAVRQRPLSGFRSSCCWALCSCCTTTGCSSWWRRGERVRGRQEEEEGYFQMILSMIGVLMCYCHCKRTIYLSVTFRMKCPCHLRNTFLCFGCCILISSGSWDAAISKNSKRGKNCDVWKSEMASCRRKQPKI